MREKCQDCRFWECPAYERRRSQFPINVPRDCRRHAPLKPDDGRDGVWPVTLPADWCGDFELTRAPLS